MLHAHVRNLTDLEDYDAGSFTSGYTEAVGDGTATSFTITHSLGTTAVLVQCWLSGELVLADVDVVDGDTVTVSTSPTVTASGALTVNVVAAGGTSTANPDTDGTVEFAWVGAVDG